MSIQAELKTKYVTDSIILICAYCTCETAARSDGELIGPCDYNLTFSGFRGHLLNEFCEHPVQQSAIRDSC